MNNKKTHLIIGTSAAALGVLNKLRTLDTESEIICISDEPELPYNKCFLADYVSGNKDLSTVFTKPLSFFEQQRIQLMLGKRVVTLDTAHKKVILNDGLSISYDTLFLGTGSSPVIPVALQQYQQAQGFFTFHTLADSNNLLDYVREQNVRRAVVVGTGLSGLECADALATRGVQVTVVGRHGQVLRKFVDQQGSSFIEQMMPAQGVTFLKNTEPEKIIISPDNRVIGVRMQDGTEIATDLLVVATGLRPNSELARQTGLSLQNGYVLVNESMQTSDASVWAGGDCCVVRDVFSGNLVPSSTWPDAMLQGMIAAHGMAGQLKKYPGISAVVSSSFFGTQFVTAGVVTELLPHHTAKIQSGPDFYHKLVMDNQRLVGFLLVGQVNNAPRLKRALLTGEPLP